MTWCIFHNDVCAADLKIASLTGHQRLINKLEQVLSEQYLNVEDFLSITIPQRACECCLLKIELLLNNQAKTLLGTQEYLHGNMQTNPHDSKENKDTNELPKSVLHQYNCECHECQNKFGSLPLLVQVIEGQEKTNIEKSAPSTSISKPNNGNQSESTAYTTNLDFSEPSTSYAKIDSSPPTSSHKKTMMCPHCSKNFTHRGDLNKHVRKHTGEQPYSCHVCQRKFAHTSNLNRHLKVHSGDRPHVCSVCNKNFSRKDKLDMHKKTKLCKKFSEKS